MTDHAPPPAGLASRVRKFEIYEVEFFGVEPTGSHVEVDLEVVFEGPGTRTRIPGFYAGNGRYLVRFSPATEGRWTYRTSSSFLEETVGEFRCLPARPDEHGPVRAEGLHFQHDDGTVFAPFGTTAYAWTHQPPELIAQTLRTLATAPFNKLRMCVFPKSMAYNSDEPAEQPFERDADGGWNVHRPHLPFWENFENRIRDLARLGIQADVILFHPHDRWGFATLSRESCLTYLDYCLRRLSAHANVWWSLANEYDMMFDRTPQDWDAFGEFISANDPYGHPLSVHNWLENFDFTKTWVTHCSIQSSAVHATAQWRTTYSKPVINDECRYEGDIEEPWGQLSPFELVHRFWATILQGGYCTHGETYYRDDEILWWAKGGELRGGSAPRIGFLRALVEELGGMLDPAPDRFAINPNDAVAAPPANQADNLHLRALARLDAVGWERFREGTAKYQAYQSDRAALLTYFGRSCQSTAHLDLSEDEWTLEILDVWNMTRTRLPGTSSGRTRLALPGREGIAVLARRARPAAQ
ncbi:MAG: DUF4038 domain-containing protein [Microbacteriaceae bacterium]|nr:DUF4038 domain-containing protein [Microbacteriaceae bacterium]